MIVVLLLASLSGRLCLAACVHVGLRTAGPNLTHVSLGKDKLFVCIVDFLSDRGLVYIQACYDSAYNLDVHPMQPISLSVHFQ